MVLDEGVDREELLVRIKTRSVRDEIDLFMLGLSAPLERELMRYIYANSNCVNLNMLDSHFCLVLGVCTHKTLTKRLESLVKFSFLIRSEYRGSIFYEVKKDEL